MKIAICSDHRGYFLKKKIVEQLNKLSIETKDFGTFSEERTDYPIYAFELAHAVVNKEFEYGVVICASGIGMNISSNKVKGARSAVARNVNEVCLAKQHNNINILSLGADFTNLDDAMLMINTLINVPFLKDRYQKRIEMIEKYEKEN